jgi:predicted RecA/RadA family phage recombinase
MKNYVQSGAVLTLTAPYAVSSGGGALVGSIFGVAVGDVANGAVGEFQVEGVFDLAKETGTAWSVGDLIYWDNANKRCTKTSSGNKLVGVAVAAAASGAAVGQVRLNGAFVG